VRLTLADLISVVAVFGIGDDVIELVKYGPANIKCLSRRVVAHNLLKITEVDQNNIGRESR
jgi:hypothetical protein